MFDGGGGGEESGGPEVVVRKSSTYSPGGGRRGSRRGDGEESARIQLAPRTDGEAGGDQDMASHNADP